MPYRNFTLEEFSEYIGWDVRKINHLAMSGELPAERIGDKWRFNKVRVIEWLQQEIPGLDLKHLMALESAMGRVVVDRDPQIESAHRVLTELMGISGINMHLEAKTKRSVLSAMLDLAENTGLVYDREGLQDALIQREGMCSTGLPGGVAIPHPRHPMPYAAAEPFVCLGRLERGIAFGAPDGKMTNLFFLICCQDESHHLHVLSRLARLLNGKVLSALNDADDADLALQILIDAENGMAIK